MSLIKCPECDKEISSEVTECPYCGKKIYKASDILIATSQFISSAISFGFLCFVAWMLYSCNSVISKSNEEYKINESKSAEITEKLSKELSPDIIKIIQEIKIKARNDNKDYSVDIYVKNTDILPPYIAKTVIKKIINILISLGQNPYKEQINISAFVGKKVKGETGQDMVMPFGKSRYRYDNDTIVWSDFDDSNFFKFGEERRI